MSGTTQGRRYMTPPEVADELGIHADRVLGMIRRGELQAIDVSEPTSTRPRYKIAPQWLAEWLQRRTVAPPAPKPVRRTTRLPKPAKDFFPD